MRILSLNYETALGSAVHATPVFSALRKLRPDWEVHVACSGITQQLLAGNPGIFKMHVTAHPVKQTWQTALQFVNIGIQNKFDAVLINTGNTRPKVAWNARFVRADKRIGVSTGTRFADVCISKEAGQSVAANNLLLLKPLIPDIDINVFAETFEVYFNKAARNRALQFRNGSLVKNRPVIGFVTQTSGGQPSEWWDDRFIAVASRLRDITGSLSVFFGTKEEATRVNYICGSLGQDGISLAGATKVEEIGAFCAACDLLISLDSGIMHIGRAIGVPTVVIAPAWQPAYEWLPLQQPKIKVLRRWDIGCRHCLKFNCTTKECMDEISVDDVVSAGLKHLELFPPDEAMRRERLERWTIY